LARHGHRLSKTEHGISPFDKRHHDVEHAADRGDKVAGDTELLKWLARLQMRAVANVWFHLLES
jgi:hypothetical protein